MAHDNTYRSDSDDGDDPGLDDADASDQKQARKTQHPKGKKSNVSPSRGESSADYL